MPVVESSGEQDALRPFRAAHPRFLRNLRQLAQPHFDQVVESCLPAADIAAARQEILSWPHYSPTPLRTLNGLARRLGLASVVLKDESARFGTGSFKVLGGAYASIRLIADRLEIRCLQGSSFWECLKAADTRARVQAMTLTCATDGNHGRAVAWAAAEVGCQCVIFIHEGVSVGREAALRALGARVQRTVGNYDDSVRVAHEAARAKGWIVVADTSTDETEFSPRYVMSGYTVLVEEIRTQLIDSPPPTHVFIQAGVGGLAAAFIAQAYRVWSGVCPRIVVVEPEHADCVFRSIASDRPTSVRGSLDTLMAGLACGEISYWAWPILRMGVEAVLALPDELVVPTMQLLSWGTDHDPSLTIGESGVAGLSAAIVSCTDPLLSKGLGLSSESRILLIGTEGASDPELYRQLIHPDAARGRQQSDFMP